MAFTNDPTTAIGKVRLYGGDADTDTHVFEDTEVTAFISQASSNIFLAAYFLVLSKMAFLAALPSNQSFSSYSQGMDLGALDKVADRLKKTLEEMGIAVDGEDLAQYGFAEIARDVHSWRQVEANKAARGETY